MGELSVYLAGVSAFLWWAVLLVPWRPWSTRIALEATPHKAGDDLHRVTALIPARNEASVIGRTLAALRAQGRGVKVVVVDDQSADDTAQRARAALNSAVVVRGSPPPPGWSGKLWALEQARAHCTTDLVLLLDADIALAPGLVAALVDHQQRCGAALVSLMAVPPMGGWWEKMLMPAFVYFFMLLYPFRISNSRQRWVAAAAGGCVLMETRVLEEIGGFAALKGALIDDCSLARRVKVAGHGTWIGLTHGASSSRPYARLADLWNMVARSAFTQLRYSSLLLTVCTLLMGLAFWAPVAGLVSAAPAGRIMGALALLAMALSYLPTLRFYGRRAAWAVALPVIGTLYLAMTWTSAVRYWLGVGACWKGRSYGRHQPTPVGASWPPPEGGEGRS